MGNMSGSYGSHYTLWASITENSYSIADNLSNVTVKLYLTFDGSSYYAYTNNRSYGTMSVTRWLTDEYTDLGEYSIASLSFSSGQYKDILLAQWNDDVSHHPDGKKTLKVKASWDTGTSRIGSGSCSAELELTNIPRNAYFSKHSINSTGLTSVKVLYRPDRTITAAEYSLNGAGWKALPIISGTWNSPDNDIIYQVTGLSPNTEYSIKTRIQYANNLWTESGALSFTTKDIARITSAPNIDIGASHKITWTNPSGAALTLKLCKTDGTTVIDYGTVTGTSKTVTPTANTLYALIPKANSVTLKYILTTAGTYTNYKNVVFTVSNSNPTFKNFTYEDTNSKTISLTGSNQILVNGYSNVKGIVSVANKATAINSATMSNYKLLIGNKSNTVNYSSSSDVSLNINNVNSGKIQMYAIDSRGNSTELTKNATIKNYSDIKIISLAALRENNVGTVVSLEFKANYWNQNFGSVENDIVQCYYKYKLTSDSNYTTGTTTLTYSKENGVITGKINIQGDLGVDGFNSANNYNIQLVITDKLSTATSTVTLGAGNPAIAIYKNKVAIGKKYDKSDNARLQVDGDVRANEFKGTASRAWAMKAYHSGSNLANTAGWYKIGSVRLANYNDLSATLLITHEYARGDFGLLKIKCRKDTGDIYFQSFKWGVRYGFGEGQAISVVSGGSATFYIYNSVPQYGRIGVTVLENSSRGGNGGLVLYESTAPESSTPTATITATDIPQAVSVLYDNTSGTTGTVTLNQTAANFSYLEIYYFNNDSFYSYTKVYSPNGKNVDLSSNTAQASGGNLFIKTKIVNINGKSITTASTRYKEASLKSSVSVTDSNVIYITRVLGYR